METGFSGKIILVTGATSGIGRAAVIGLARKGASVIASGRRLDKGAEVVDAANAAGSGSSGSAQFLQADISDQESIDALFAAIEAGFPRLDGAFNNAGF